MIDAIAAANTLDTAYDGDRWSQQLDGRFSDLFGTRGRACCGRRRAPRPTASRSPRSARRTARSICHRDAHIQNDECGAPGFYTPRRQAAARRRAGREADARCDRRRARRRSATTSTRSRRTRCRSPTRPNMAWSIRPTRSRRSAISPRRAGSASTWTARASPTRSRISAATLADLTWRAGVDALSFGFVKNGGMSAEALVFFKPELAAATLYRRKRAGLLLSKGRYLAAQILAMLDDDLWLANARAANAGAALLADGGGRPAGPSGRGERGVPARRRRTRPRACARWASISTTGRRARCGWSRPGTSSEAAIQPLADAIAALAIG